jgi:hypothetical protein
VWNWFSHFMKRRMRVTCDDHASHSVDLQPLLFQNEEEKTRSILHDPVAYGKKLYAALFPPNSIAQQALATMPERLLIVASDPLLDAIPWEYVYGPYRADDSTSPGYAGNFLVLECPFVRGLPTSQRISPPLLTQSLHIVAIPSNPLSDAIEPLAIDTEWVRLKETIHELPYLRPHPGTYGPSHPGACPLSGRQSEGTSRTLHGTWWTGSAAGSHALL